MGNEINIGTVYILITLAALWTIPWKGVALWKSARNGDPIWFIILLLVNTLGILEMIYIFFFSGKKKRVKENYSGEQNTIR